MILISGIAISFGMFAVIKGATEHCDRMGQQTSFVLEFDIHIESGIREIIRSTPIYVSKYDAINSSSNFHSLRLK